MYNYPPPTQIEHDQVCLVCDEWIVDATDKIKNFIDCPLCPQSYHKQCIKLSFAYSQTRLSCNEIFKNDPNHKFQCCSLRRPQLMLSLPHKPYLTEYYQKINGKRTKPILKHQRQSNQQYFICKRYKRIIWKNVEFQTGDNIEIEMENGEGDVR